MKDSVQSTSYLQRLIFGLIQQTVVKGHQLYERHYTTEHSQHFRLFGSLEDDDSLGHIFLEAVGG